MFIFSYYEVYSAYKVKLKNENAFLFLAYSYWKFILHNH